MSWIARQLPCRSYVKGNKNKQKNFLIRITTLKSTYFDKKRSNTEVFWTIQLCLGARRWEAPERQLGEAKSASFWHDKDVSVKAIKEQKG